MCAVIALPARSQCIPRDEKVEAQVEALLAKMSLKDKVGQMCELAIDKVVQNPMAPRRRWPADCFRQTRSMMSSASTRWAPY